MIEPTTEQAPLSDDLSLLFSEDLTSVDISRPLLANGTVQFRVTAMSVGTNETTGRRSLVIETETNEDWKTTKGESLPPGFKITHRIGLDETEKYDTEAIRRNIKTFQVACGHNGPFGALNDYMGATFKARVSTENDPTGRYAPQNRLSFVTKR